MTVNKEYNLLTTGVIFVKLDGQTDVVALGPVEQTTVMYESFV